MARRLLFIVDTESQLVPAFRIAERFAEESDWLFVGNVIPSKNAPTRRQVVNSDVHCTLTSYSLKQLFEQKTVFDFDAVLVLLPGSSMYTFVTQFQDGLRQRDQSRRPIVLTAYNGVVYEKHLEGLLWRIGYDFIGVNSRADHERFSTDLVNLGVDAAPLVRTGVVHAQDRDPELQSFHSSPTKNVLFATQAIVPQARAERVFILEKLKVYAETYPDRKVFIKPRSMPWERTFHQEEFHYETLYDTVFGIARPPNLLFAYGRLERYMASVSLIISVSSTAIFEGLAHGIPGAVLADVGLKESLGNHFFRDSGMLTTMDSLIRDQIPEVRQDWLLENGFHPDDSIRALVDAVDSALDEQERTGRMRPLEPVYYGPKRAPFLYESQLPFKGGVVKRVEAEEGSVFRKARKLVRSPLNFVLDSKLLRADD